MFRTAFKALCHSAALGWVDSITNGSTSASPCETARRPMLRVPLQNSEA